MVSDTEVHFYHILLPKVNLELLSKYLPHAQNLTQKDDKTLALSLSSPAVASATIEKLLSFFENQASLLLETPKFYYSIDPNIKNLLKNWALSFLGCLGLLLTYNPRLVGVIRRDWKFINSSASGLYIPPYTLLFNDDHPRIIHPVTTKNSGQRKVIEQEAARLIRYMIKNIQEAQPGLEGLALLSVVKEKTGFSVKEITNIINSKSFGIQNPKNCPLFL